MLVSPSRVILGSRSPQRLELLSQIVPPTSIEVIPPRASDEADFDGLTDWPAIEARMIEIAKTKYRDVLDQLTSRPAANQAESAGETYIVTADTVVVFRDNNGDLSTHGQPPEVPSWPDVVRCWFVEDYAGKTHTVATALCVGRPGRQPLDRIVKSEVTFHHDVDRHVDAYLATGEPLGKAGGYAVQGAGSIFITNVAGSLSNVVGLPLRELLDLLTTG